MKLKERIAHLFGFTEHGCAIAYAACEFWNAHPVLIGLSGGLLAAGGMLLIARALDLFATEGSL